MMNMIRGEHYFLSGAAVVQGDRSRRIHRGELPEVVRWLKTPAPVVPELGRRE